MEQIYLVKVIDFKNGAYPIKEVRNRTAYSENAFFVSQAVGSDLHVKNHCKLYFKTIDTMAKDQYGRLMKYTFLICKKDCIVLKEIN